MDDNNRILVINPGSTSTKIGVFNNEFLLLEKNIMHPSEKLASFNRVVEQNEFRKQAIFNELDKEGINFSKFNAICGRGGLLRPIPGGTYQVNDYMLQDLKIGFNGEHPSNLGGIIAYEIGNALNIPAYIVDPVVIDELEELARITGFPDIPRRSIFHALNHKSVARLAAEEIGNSYSSINLIVGHLGGGITVGAHRKGRVIDVNNGLHGDGPFSPERAGTIPTEDLVAMCFSGMYTQEQMMKRIVNFGGLKAYLDTDNIIEIIQKVSNGERTANLVYQAMAYQVAKEIGSMSAVLQGEVDGIVLTGPIAEDENFITMVSERVKWIADVFVYPGDNDIRALAMGALRVLRGDEAVRHYSI